MRECEIKLRVRDAGELRRRLEAAGAEPAGEKAFEDNRIYDDERGSLAATRRILRLRTTGDGPGARHVVTFKAPLDDAPAGDGSGQRYKIRTEHETSVGDPEVFDRVLRGLGYRQTYRYQKYRQSYRLGALHVEVDETPIGTFCELEGEAEDIDRAAAALGFSGEPYITKNYRELHEEIAGRRDPGDLVFASR